VFIDPGGVEECVEVLAVDPESQPFDAVVTKDHPASAMRPSVCPTPILNEGYNLGFDIPIRRTRTSRTCAVSRRRCSTR